MIYRGAEYTHMLELPERDGKPVPCPNAVLHRAEIRVWGFHCPQGWKPRFKFVNRDEPGETEPGCDDSKPYSRRPVVAARGAERPAVPKRFSNNVVGIASIFGVSVPTDAAGDFGVRLGDWAVFRVGNNSLNAAASQVAEAVLNSGFFDEHWQLPPGNCR